MKNNNFLSSLRSFKVSKYAKIWFALPLLVIIIAVAVIIGLGAGTGNYSNAVGIGIDFEGGSVINVELDNALDYNTESAKIKRAIQAHGVTVSYTQQSTGTGETFFITFRYKNISNDDVAIEELNNKIITSIDKLYPDNVNDVTNFITYESIGSTAASDLLSKAGIAVAVSCLLIMIYIMFRFTLVSGIAAILALLHDVIIMFALTVICRIQINTSFIAAMITIIAYSINNTIIIFDRCRETLKPLKGQKDIDYKEIGDEAVVANMRRSIYTTLTTMVTIVFLAILGSDSIREFCVPILLGLIAGLYSSVFLATPMWSKMSFQYAAIKEKYQTRHGVNYKKTEVEEEIDLTAPKKLAATDDDDEGFTPRDAKSVKPKQDKPKGKPVHKYSKKNTTFKKK